MSHSLTIAGIETIDAAGSIQLRLGMDLGAPAVETQHVSRLLYDGDVVTGERSGNRVISLPLVAVGATSLLRAAAISQLTLAVDRPFQMVWTPTDGLPVVFDCFRASVQLDYDTFRMAGGQQNVTLTFEAAPFTRTPGLVSVTPAAAVPAVTIDAYNSTAGLTFTGGSGTTLFSAMSAVTSPKVQGTHSLFLRLSISTTTPTFGISATVASTDLSATSVATMWMQADTTTFPVSYADLTLTSAGGSKTWRLSSPPTASPGWFPLSWDLTATPTGTSGTLSLAAVTSYSWTVGQANPTNTTGAPAQNIRVDYLSGGLAGGSQMTGPAGWFVFNGVGGSSRAPVSLSLDASSAVSRVLLSRSPNVLPGFTPVVTTPASFAGSTVDATAIGGTRYGAPVYRIDASSLTGTFAIMVRAKATSASGTITATANITSDTSVQQVETVNIAGASTSAFAIYTIGALTLPPRGVDPLNSAATFDITLDGTAMGNSFDQMYLVDLEGDSVLIDLPSSLSYRYWWIDAPEAGQLASSVYAGSASDRSDAVSVAAWAKGPAAFNFTPGSNTLTVVCDKASGTPTLTASYYQRNLYERAS